MRHSVDACLLTAALAAAISFATPAAAQEQPDDLTALRSELSNLRQQDQERRAQMQDLERRLSALEATTSLAGLGVELSDADKAGIRGRGAAMPRARDFGDGMVAFLPDTTEGGGADSSSTEEVRKAPAPTQAVATVTEAEQGFFSRRLSFEVGTTYSHFDDARLNLSGFLALDAIFLGLINLEQITADVATVDFAARYRLTDRLQTDVSIPYLFRYTNYQSGGAGSNAAGLIEADRTDHGLGDVSVGASYRLLREKVRFPDVVINARVKAPTGREPFGVELVEVPNSSGNLAIPMELSTGSGVWGASLGVSLLKTLDPMVVFGSLSYFRNFENDFDDLDEAVGEQPGKAKIGDAIQFGAGVAFALNDRSSLSLSVTQRIVQRTRLARRGQPLVDVVGSQANVGVLNIGSTFALTDRISLLTTLGVGLTTDAPDMVLSIRLPFSF